LSIAPDGRHLVAGGGTGYDDGGDGVGIVDPADQDRFTVVDVTSGAGTELGGGGTTSFGSTPLSWSPDGRWMVRRGSVGREVSPADSTSWTAVPHDDGTGCTLCWSPDGSYLAIRTAEGLMIGEGSGAGMHVDRAIPSIWSWSSDGHRIAFVRDGDAWAADVDGSNVQNVTNFGSGGAESAVLSPDGGALAVIQAHKTLWLIDGSGAPRSVDLSADLTDQGSRVVWSPNGRWLAVVPQWDGLGTPLTILVSIDGAVITRVIGANNLWSVTENDYEPRLRAWSPDGSRIAIWTSPWDDPRAATTGTTNRLGTTYLVAADGSTLKVDDAWSAAWAPDGRSFAVLGGKVDSSRIDIVAADGNQRHTVSTGPIARPGDPTWVR
jgi:Tol biopolymer transport system component